MRDDGSPAFIRDLTRDAIAPITSQDEFNKSVAWMLRELMGQNNHLPHTPGEKFKRLHAIDQWAFRDYYATVAQEEAAND
jgi:hypothetical protein